MTVWICDECDPDDRPCTLDGGEDAGDPLVCPWCPTCTGNWRVEEEG